MPGPQRNALLVMAAFFLAAPLGVYPVFLMKAMCFALFACAFNLLIGYVGLLSFGHALISAGQVICRLTPRKSGASRLSLRF